MAERLIPGVGIFQEPSTSAEYLIPGGHIVSVAVSAVSCALAEDITTEADIVTGGNEITLTLTNDTWDADIGADNAQTQALIDGIDSAQGEGAGWDAVVKVGLDFDDVTRDSAVLVTITLPAFAGYDITATETITATVPASALAGADPVEASPAFTVIPVSAGPPVGSLAMMGVGI